RARHRRVSPAPCRPSPRDPIAAGRGGRHPGGPWRPRRCPLGRAGARRRGGRRPERGGVGGPTPPPTPGHCRHRPRRAARGGRPRLRRFDRRPGGRVRSAPRHRCRLRPPPRRPGRVRTGPPGRRSTRGASPPRPARPPGTRGAHARPRRALRRGSVQRARAHPSAQGCRHRRLPCRPRRSSPPCGAGVRIAGYIKFGVLVIGVAGVVALVTPEHTSIAIRVAVFFLAGTVAVALLDFANHRSPRPAPSPFEPRPGAPPPPNPPADVVRFAVEFRAYQAASDGGTAPTVLPAALRRSMNTT